MFGELYIVVNMTTVSTEIIKRIEDKILEVMLLLQKRYNVVLELPKYSFRQMGTKGGLAYYRDYRIELNSDFFKNYCEEMINQVVPHEIAHLVSFKVYGPLGRGHGQFWKGVMSSLRPLGVTITRCHSFSLEGVKHRRVAKPFAYKCGCMVHNVTLNIHTKIARGSSRRCIRCRQKLTYQSVVQGTVLHALPKIEKEEMYDILGGDPIFAQQAS